MSAPTPPPPAVPPGERKTPASDEARPPQSPRTGDPSAYGAAVLNARPTDDTLYTRARGDLTEVVDALTAQARTLADTTYYAATRGALIAEARRLRAEVIDAVTMAVLAERARGASWADVADALGLDERFVVEHYEPIERQWTTGNGIGPIVTVQTGTPALRVVTES